MFSKYKSIIPLLYLFSPVRKPILPQCLIHFLLGKAEAVLIFFRSRCHHLKMIQIREHGLPADTCDACHNGPLQIRIRLKSGVEQTAGKRDKLFPVAVHIGFLHGSVIFIQKDKHFFPVIPGQIQREYFQGKCRRMIFHIHRYLPKFFFLIRAEKLPFQQEIVLVIEQLYNTAQRFPGLVKRVLLNICKTELNHRICPLKLPILFLLPDVQSLKQVFPPCIFHREKFLHHAHGQRLSKTPGAGDQCHLIPLLPPLFYETGFVHIEAVSLPDFLKILVSNAHRPNHIYSSFS